MQYVADHTLRIVFLSGDPSIVMTYDTVQSLHMVWALRRVKPEVHFIPWGIKIPGNPVCIFVPLCVLGNALDLGFVSFVGVRCWVGLVLWVFKEFFPWICLEQGDRVVVMVVDYVINMLFHTLDQKV